MQRAVNPKTGEVLFLVNNQWTPPSQTAKNPKTGQSAYLVNNEWQILDPFKMGQESGEAKTTNPFLGFVGRGAELIGSGVEAVAEVGERLGDKLELAMPLSNLTPEQVKNEQQLKPLFDFAKSLEDFNKNIGYSPSTKLSDLPGNPLKTIPFVAERVITSTPDMAAAFAAAPAYFTARTKEILDERVKNDNKTLDDATIGDVSTAAGAAAFETLFERFAVGRLLPGGGATGKTAPGRIAKETGIQSGTEFAEEFGTYAAETAGTKKGFDLEEASLAGLEGAIVGGGLGATVQTSKEGLDAYRRSKDQTSPDAEPEDPISTTPAGPVDPTLTAPITPTPVLEQEGAIAPAPQIAPVSQPTPIQIYNNPLDEVTAEVIANPDNRFSVRMTDLTTGQTMDGGTFDTADEANARAAQSIGMSIKPIAPVGPVQAPPAATPPTVAPPTVTPPEAAVTPPASAPISQEPVIPTSGFRTEKGSIYSLDEQGRTSRTKMSEGKGKGTTYDPHAALYVKPEDAQSILSDMQSGSMDDSASVRLGYIDVENNVFKNITDTSQIPAGAEAVVGVVDKNKNQLIGSYKAQLTPAVGLSPVEKMYTPDGMSNTHIGNKIVELFGQATPAATPAVEPTVTPETPPEAPPVSTRTAQEVQVDVNRTRQQIRQAKTAVKKGTVGPEFVSPLEAKLEALENELSQVKAAPRKAAPKYRDSKGNTWTGRGLQPAWLKEALGEGREIDEFAILPQLDNKSQDELVGRSEFPLIVPDARRAEIEQEIEDSLKKIRSLERPTGQDNLFTMLRGKFPKGYFKKNKIDISESLRNRLESDTGRSTLDSVVETGNLDRFFPEDSRIGNLASQRAEGTSRDLSRELDVVKDNVETLINKLESNDPLSEDTNLLMIELDLRIQELEKELQLEDVNQELSEVAIEERRIAQQIEADAIAEQEGTAASPEGQVREPEQPDFELRGQTQKELTDLERKDKTGEAERLRKERETREMVDRERDAFTLQPTTQPPLAKPAAPTGDLFGAKPTREEQAAINRARQAERRKQTAASKQQPKNIYKTTDGYTFFELSDGSIVDNIDPEKVDLSWPSVKEFLSDMDGSAWKFGDEVGLRRAFVKTGLDPDDKKLIEKLNRFDTDFVSITNFYRARREQLISAKRKSEIKLVSSRREAEKGKVREQLKLFEQEPISANEDNRAGQAARRDAVSTVDDLQSTNNPLAMALSKDYAARQRVTLVGQSVKSYDDLAILSQVYRHPSFESVRMFFVNDAGEVVSQLGVTSRLPGSSAAIMGKDGEEYVSKVQTAAQKSGATGVWMLHNHPSGNVTPSNADEILTRLFVQRFNKLDYKGHVIIDTNQYSVISPTGSIINISKDMSQKDLVAYRPETYKQILEPITIAKRVDENPQSMVIIALNNDAKVTGITTIDNDFFKRKTDSQIRRAFYKLAISNFSSRLLVATRDLDALDKVAGMVQDGILIEPNGKFKGLTEIYTRRSKFLFPISRPGVVTTDSSKLFDFLRIPKGKPRGAEYLTWPDIRVLLEKNADQMTFQEPQDDLFGDENKTLHELSENLPKAKKKLPPGRSPELAALAQLLQQGKVTKEEFDAAVNKYRPIPVYEEPLEPATDQQVVNALYSDKQPRANVTVATGTKVGLRLDIPAWNRHKTFVVAIHEKRKSASAVGKSIGYRSVAMVKNVVFTVGNQLKALEIAAGEGKSALQTMEGEYVDVSPADALEMAKKAIKSDRYIQVGFDPIRHSYFFDRRTTLPVLKADAVLQIGNMILARGVEFGKKESFLYNIDATPQMTEAEISQGVTDVREEQIAEYTRLRAKRERLVQEVIGGANTIDTQRELTNLDNVTKALKEDIDAEYTPSTSPANFLNRALKAFDKGDMSAEVLATIQEAYNKTPFILNGLRLSIRTPKDGTREIGNFNPFERIVTLWNGTRGVEKPSTIRHELTHSLEQMMTAIQRKLLVDAWSKDFEKAVKKNTDAPSRLYFKKVLQFIDNPSQESFAAATAAMPSYEFYQYMSPSEYWAVNAETLMASKLGTAWSRFVAAIKKYVEALKNVFGFNNKYAIHKTFDQLMRDKPTRMSTDSLIDFVASAGARPVTLSNISQNVFGQPLPEASWGRPDDSKKDDFVYIFADKQVDTKKVLQSIRKAGKQIIDKWNPYLLEELFHGRTATRTKKFLKEGLEPLIKEIGDRGLNIEIVEKYLHNRHAKARNDFNAKRDPNMPDGGSGIKTAAAQAYLDGLDPKQKRNLEAVAKMVDDIVNGTQEVLVKTGQESQETIDAWKKALPNYVPLQREETDYDIKNVGIGVGSGFAVKGPFSRAAVGSSRKVVDILANLAAQRERAIVRGEKMRVAKALYGLVVSNPNPGFWLAFDPDAIKNPQEAINDLVAMGLNKDDAKNLIDEPVTRRIDPVTNTVVERPNSLLVNSRTSMPVRINGKEKYIIFNSNDPRATRMAEAMKNLDADQLGRVLNYTQQITQYFAKINTQYNPIFGVINFARDIQGAVLQLSTTPLRYKKKEVLSGVLGALRGIYAEERRSRAGKPPSKDSYAELWREFQEMGGQTGFRDQFSRMQDRADALQAILDPSSWTKSPLGKVFTAGGTLKVPLETARKIAAPVFDWLSDYNQTMENAVRLSAYKVAKEQKKNGVRTITDEQAASLAKNLTVNFNRKGQIGRQAGALYAFFNAAVRGTARMYETLRGPAGQKIIWGGLILGSAQAALLAAFDFDEDEPPDFVKERNIVIPTGGGKYITVPMPLGYNVIPNTSRILTEWTMSGFKDTHKRVAQITGAALDMFNPIGNAGWSIQTLAPTVADPLVALAENKDWTGKPIAKEDISNLDPTPGYSRSKETASYISKAMAKFLNAATGGTDYTPGGASPTPDQIDYLIGQLTGGVGRELLKAEQTVTSQFTGEELPIYKVPLVGRFVGDSEGQAAERNRFYNNIILLNKHEREIKGRQKDRIPTRDYLMEYPEARLYSYANQVERNIRTLRKRRDALIEQDAPKERVKQVENQMTVQMKRFNERVKSAQE
jgi:DNA-binding protein H-NS